MSEDDVKSKFKVFEGGDNIRALEPRAEKEQKETNEALHKILSTLADRASKGELESFIMTIKTTKGSVESMIGGLDSNFDFVGSIGMLEVLKDRLMQMMAQFSYMYYSSEDEDGKDDEET